MNSNDNEEDWNQASNLTGGYVVGEGESSRSTKTIKLVKKRARKGGSTSQNEPKTMYDVSKLKTDVFAKVLKYITDNLKD